MRIKLHAIVTVSPGPAHVAAAAVSVSSPEVRSRRGVFPHAGNAYTCQDSTNTTFTGGDIISDAAMRAAMHAVLDKSRSVGGVPTTLASLGYSYISMDDGTFRAFLWLSLALGLLHSRLRVATMQLLNTPRY
eukprot:COSAG01_NODE_6858_length_3467_cov_3.421021_5_plen_132_part_00